MLYEGKLPHTFDKIGISVKNKNRVLYIGLYKELLYIIIII